jgi:hypothetical protein
MSIAWHISRQMLQHYSPTRFVAELTVLDWIATPLLLQPAVNHKLLRVLCANMITKSGCLNMVLPVGYWIYWWT